MTLTLTRDEITARASKVLTDHIAANGSQPPSEVTADFVLLGGDGFDSLDFVEFQMDLEEAFHIEIPDDAAEQMKTFGAAVEYLARLLGAEVAA
jgi:acyl carrier protein